MSFSPVAEQSKGEERQTNNDRGHTKCCPEAMPSTLQESNVGTLAFAWRDRLRSEEVMLTLNFKG